MCCFGNKTVCLSGGEEEEECICVRQEFSLESSHPSCLFLELQNPQEVWQLESQEEMPEHLVG